MQREEFLALLSSEGFNQVVTVEREPNGSLDVHAHPFEAKALILRGSLKIRCDGEERDYRAGDIFHLAKDAEHEEDFGPDGVSYLVGRK